MASLQIWSTTCSGVVLSHEGGVREYGMAEDDMPFPFECNLPILAQKFGACREVKKSVVVIFLARSNEGEDIAKVRARLH